MKRLLLTLVFILGLAVPSNAAITRGVGPEFATSPPASTCVMTLAGTTAGRMLVIGLVWYEAEAGGPFTPSSITISGESNATLIAGSKVSNAPGANESMQFAYLAQLSGGGSKTITVTWSGTTYASCGVMEYAGQDTASQPDASTNETGTDPGDSSEACVTTPITTTTDNALIVALCMDVGAAPTAGSGFTVWGGGMPNTGMAVEIEDDVDVGANGVKTPTFLGGLYTSWSMSVVAFKAASGGGGGVPVRHRVSNQ